MEFISRTITFLIRHVRNSMRDGEESRFSPEFAVGPPVTSPEFFAESRTARKATFTITNDLR